MVTSSTLGEMLLKNYVTDFIGKMQNLSSPIYSLFRSNDFIPTRYPVCFADEIEGVKKEVHERLKTTTKFTLSGTGTFFKVK